LANDADVQLVAVNLLFVAVLVFSVTWRNPRPEAVTAELYAPAPKIAPAPPPQPAAPPPQPAAEPPKPQPPKPVIEPPKPEPPRPEPPKPVIESPKPQPRPVATPEPDRRAADIAQKAKAEEDKRKQQEREKAEAERKKAEDKRLADARERQQRDLDAMKAQADRETRQRADAEREAQLRAQADAESRSRADLQAKAQADAARARVEADWIRRVQAKIRGNVTLPPDIPGNPEAIFEVVQLPTGEIIDVQLRKSSGLRAYDDAVQRAILKSSPLPLPPPDRRDLFQRNVTLKFRPAD
jgi:colicin import membrane protein